MSFKILSGTGNGKEVGVDNTNRLRTRAITEPEANHAAELEQRYNVSTGTVNLTSASASAVAYLKNLEDSDIYIESLIYNLGASASGTGESTIDVYFGTTGGTIVSDATAVAMSANHKVGSASTLTANAYKGAEGKTQTGGTQSVSSLIGASTRAVISLGKIVLPKGQSISVVVTPPTSNTSMNVQVAFSIFVGTPEVLGGNIS